MSKTIVFKANKEESKIIIQKFLCGKFDTLSLEDVASIITSGSLKVNGVVQNGAYGINEGDDIEVTLNDFLCEKSEDECSFGNIESIKKLIVYEDDNILIANKPASLLVQRNIAFGPSLESYIRDYLAKNDPSSKASAAHRLDRGTSGLVIFGKSKESLSALGVAFMNRDEIKKTYTALALGKTPAEGIISVPLGKDKTTGNVSPCPVDKGGKPCVTRYTTTERYKDYSLLQVNIETGRNHQIRAHLLSIGHPIAGDPRYGEKDDNEKLKKRFGLSSQFLHAGSLSFISLHSPLDYLNGKTFTAPLPLVEEKMLKELEQ